MDDLAIAFAIRCDENSLTVAEGIEAAEKLADELMGIAEDRAYGF
jgi:hypothetical protein